MKSPLIFLVLSGLQAAFAADLPNRDEFYWLSEINKATIVINHQEGLLDRNQAQKFGKTLQEVIDEVSQLGKKRPSTVISYEPLLIAKGGLDVTLIHAGRSSQDMHATYRSAMLRDDLIVLSNQLNQTMNSIWLLAEKNQQTIVPNYTNGVGAQPNSYAHYLLGYLAGFERDQQRIREAYERIDRCAMGTTVLNGSSWPLNRQKMSDYLGFAQIVDNAYDASQISSTDEPVEVAEIIISIALHASNLIEDITTQYAQTRPWILLTEGGKNTYVSSAMPQKRNPGLLIDTRADASNSISNAMSPIIKAHNIQAGMSDAKNQKQNREMVQGAVKFIKELDEVINALVIDPNRALEELNNDWTASQEIADLLMRKYHIPFRVGHHFASNIVEYSKKFNIKPMEFTYEKAQMIFKESIAESEISGPLPLSEIEFKEALNPTQIVNNRKTVGGSQPSEIRRMLASQKQKLLAQSQWSKNKSEIINASLSKLDQDFQSLK